MIWYKEYIPIGDFSRTYHFGFKYLAQFLEICDQRPIKVTLSNGATLKLTTRSMSPQLILDDPNLSLLCLKKLWSLHDTSFSNLLCQMETKLIMSR